MATSSFDAVNAVKFIDYGWQQSGFGRRFMQRQAKQQENIMKQGSDWYRKPRPNPTADFVLVCLPYAGGGSTIYRDWPDMRVFITLAAHYHVYVMLKYRSFFTESFLSKHLLPVGNEDTCYLFGCAEKGQVLTISIGPELLKHHRVYCTYYNISSLPEVFEELNEQKFVSLPLPCKGTYLIRMMRMSGAGDRIATEFVSVTVGNLEGPQSRAEKKCERKIRLRIGLTV